MSYMFLTDRPEIESDWNVNMVMSFSVMILTTTRIHIKCWQYTYNMSANYKMCLVGLYNQEEKRVSGAFFLLPVSARVQLTFYIFRPILCLCKTATSSGQKIIKCSRKKAKSLDYLVEFHIVWLQLGSCSTRIFVFPSR